VCIAAFCPHNVQSFGHSFTCVFLSSAVNCYNKISFIIPMQMLSLIHFINIASLCKIPLRFWHCCEVGISMLVLTRSYPFSYSVNFFSDRSFFLSSYVWCIHHLYFSSFITQFLSFILPSYVIPFLQFYETDPHEGLYCDCYLIMSPRYAVYCIINFTLEQTMKPQRGSEI